MAHEVAHRRAADRARGEACPEAPCQPAQVPRVGDLFLGGLLGARNEIRRRAVRLELARQPAERVHAGRLEVGAVSEEAPGRVAHLGRLGLALGPAAGGQAVGAVDGRSPPIT